MDSTQTTKGPINLTPEQVELMAQVKAEWLDLVFNPKEPNIPEMVKQVEWLYEYCKLAKPNVLVLDSPYACQIAANYLMAQSEAGRDLDVNLTPEAITEVMQAIKDYKGEIKWYSFSYCDVFDAGWVSYYDFFSRIGVESNEQFDRYAEYVRAGIGFSIHFDTISIISTLPLYFKRNDQNQLHCPDGPSVLWRDGYTNWFWNGVPVSEKIIMHPEEITAKDYDDIKNAEVKRCLREKLGTDGIVRLLDIMMVHEEKMGGDQVILWKSRKPDSVTNRVREFVEVCDGSNPLKHYILEVAPGQTTAIGAIASTWHTTREEYLAGLKAES